MTPGERADLTRRLIALGDALVAFGQSVRLLANALPAAGAVVTLINQDTPAGVRLGDPVKRHPYQPPFEGPLDVCAFCDATEASPIHVPGRRAE